MKSIGATSPAPRLTASITPVNMPVVEFGSTMRVMVFLLEATNSVTPRRQRPHVPLSVSYFFS
ncbi:MAG: hypothetical protein JW913_01540 [Chitinispirillaceae bacterium]|nr:hypothetical protein [Chitinispirillaceae bacterium]